MNYGRSDYVTMGAPVMSQDGYETLLAWVEEKLDEYTFNHFDLRLEPGYYEGFYLTIEMDTENAKENAPSIYNEIDDLYAMLRELLELGMVVVTPGWRQTELDWDDGRMEIDDARRQMVADLFEEVNAYGAYGFPSKR